MDKNFKLSKRHSLSKLCIEKGHTDFDSLFNYIKQLPYGRNSNRGDYTLVLKENKGTCATKHAFLKAIALENNFDALKLYLGIFKMNAINTPKIASILKANHLKYIPEAHCYLKHCNNLLDITFGTENHTSFRNTLLYENAISPEQIGNYKINLHQTFLKTWIKKEQLHLSFEDLWNIRESCIIAISE
ncbi:hypothetical protein A9Q86_08915 [Flavobacteriales bacterium 33_180_T64]|nr:hypothetical protein A9Q86_08915 [Flavobacteriales bacterium 33_180_T64]